MNEPRMFTIVRRGDESGVSGTGRVLDGVIFHNGQVVVCWRGDTDPQRRGGFSSLGVYPSWEAFKYVHLDSHPSNEAEVVFGTEHDLVEHLQATGMNHDGEEPEGD